MAEFLTTRGIGSKIENIINSAENRVTLISPFVKIPDSLFQCLKDASSRKVKIALVYGKKELEPDVKSQLEQLGSNLSLYFLEKLHAKCFFNEDYMVITSMNLYDFSELNNEEMGVLIGAKEDEKIFKDAERKAQSIINSAEKIKLGGSVLDTIVKEMKSMAESISAAEFVGHCIRCKTSIEYNPEKPLCDDCFPKWAEYGNPDHKEKFCHSCGKPASTTKARPLCPSCYNKSR